MQVYFITKNIFENLLVSRQAHAPRSKGN